MTTEFDRHLASLRMSVASLSPPKRVDDAIAAAIQPSTERARGRKWPAARPAWLALSGVAMAALLAVAIIGRDAPRSPILDAGTAPVAGETDRAVYLPVVPVTELAEVSDALVVSAQLSRMTLAELGFPVDPAQAADVVDTELLVRADGALLAVRFVH